MGQGTVPCPMRIMIDRSTNEVGYVGRTNDPDRRQREHDRDPRKQNFYPLTVVQTGLTIEQARVYEQALISAFTLNNLRNARREISRRNLAGFADYMENVASLMEGVVAEELYDLMYWR